MPSNCTKPRIEWVPGPAALEALAMAEGLFPDLGRQAVVDRMVITGLSAYLSTPWHPPALHGKARHRWRLPADLALKLDPGNEAHRRGIQASFPGGDALRPIASDADGKEYAA